MSEADWVRQLEERLPELMQLGLASNIPIMGVGILPDPDSDWVMVNAADKVYWAHTSVLEALEHGLLDDFIAAAEELQTGSLRRGSSIGGTLSMTVFLPISLLGAIPFPSRPGSPYTVGQLLVGGLAVLAIPASIWALFTQTWWVLGVSVYWWVGSKVLERELIARGYLPG